MSMHMAHPALSTTGKRKGKKKWASSEQKQQAQKLDAEWNELMKKWGSEQRERERTRGLRAATYRPTVNPRLAEARSIPSLPDQHIGAVTVKQTPKYTGDKIVGIGTMHKSNSVPIFTDQEAKDISSMRR